MSSITKIRQPHPVQWLSHYLLGLTAIVFLIVIFWGLAEDVWFQEGFSWDAPIMPGIHSLSNPKFDIIMKLVTQTGNLGAAALALALAGWFFWKNMKIDALSVLGVFGGAVGGNALLKLTFACPRPQVFSPLVAESSFSLPQWKRHRRG